MRLHFVWIGKTRDRHCAALLEDYLGRVGRFASCEVSELKEPRGASDEARARAVESGRLLEAVGRDDYVVLLDEGGRELTSPELAGLIGARQQAGTKRLGLVIGGFAGVSREVTARADYRLALTRLTLTHELARVVLAEQVYRAYTLLAGLPYHKF
jgi:23S rRNA (pseudouridine1915-N3)-methyltransferase